MSLMMFTLSLVQHFQYRTENAPLYRSVTWYYHMYHAYMYLSPTCTCNMYNLYMYVGGKYYCM